jgi:cardiolipin synthase (CMP-forming)
VTGPYLTLPNVITILRGLAAFPLAWFVLHADFKGAIVTIYLAGLTDGLDGVIARRLNQMSDLGRALDPLADKLLLVTAFVAVSIPGRGFEPLPIWLGVMAVARDVGILIAAAVIYRRTRFTGFTPTFLGKLNTVMELGVIFLFLVTRAYDLPEPLLLAGVFATAATILASSIHYVFHARRQLAEFLSRPDRGAAPTDT